MIKQPSESEIRQAQDAAILEAADLVWDALNTTGRTKAWIAKQLGMTSVQLSLMVVDGEGLDIRMLAAIAARTNKRLILKLVDIDADGDK